ncbi:MAG: LLM class flavin-dependent oxidoreductase [Chloroflexi bacterium]|nr:LLM class flavin-dependent oxidoreductase [Chloroflexota bacterium]MDA1272232.1 LLM class flavin-dependent oxidoreductase [Chloroflexota bacterium]
MTGTAGQDKADRQMFLVAFLQASNCSNYTGSWRHPETDPGFMDLEFYQGIAATLERGKFHLAFIDDRLAMPSRYGDSFEEAVEHGIRVVKLDLVPIITAMGLATKSLGLGATYSTTYYSPFHVARLFASLDHFTKGRIAWNVVTSLNDSEAQNFGVAEHLEHDGRYNVADEFLQAACELWDSWEDGAVLLDKDTGRFADGGKVHRIDHSGESFQVRGPLTVPRSPQGHPVFIQAGQSERGRQFAARWGELLFVIYPTPEACKAYRDDLRRRAYAEGRDPESVKIAPAVYVVVDETEEQAREKLAQIEALANQTDSLTLLSEVFNYDFSQHEVDQPLSDEILASMTGLRGFLDRVIELSGGKNPTVNDFIKWSGRGTLGELPLFTGTPAQVADQMEAWFQAEACDGFVLAATHMPGAYQDFVDLVVPELQRRGLFRHDYTQGTLRDNLGFALP